MTELSKRGRPGPRRALTEDEILDATLQLLDEGGANGASVRGIAARVGVAPNAVYTYFPDKAAVIRALVERLLGEVDHGVFADRAQPWPQRVESLAVELRARLAAHPGAVTLMIGQPRTGPHALALGERLLELFADAGLTPTDAARASHLLFGYVFSSVALDIADLNQPGSASTAERVAARQRAFAAAPADQFPRVVAAAATMAGTISTEQYLWGLHRLLDGIAISQGTDRSHAADA
ncbi:MAG TPA: TetR/AcrR family transcriptional regulator [Trebonia sp.]|jgi:TetR/AcrR family tetracycline transcriptional repressor|nr:TetR/AcrR family transcriptional regulator [Trebonia sp.]